MRLTKDQSAKKNEYLGRIAYCAEMIALNKTNAAYCVELSKDLAHYWRLYRDLTGLEQAIT